jgi:hypothetical protein
VVRVARDAAKLSVLEGASKVNWSHLQGALEIHQSRESRG